MDQTMSTAVSILLTIAGIFGAVAVIWRLRAWMLYRWYSVNKAKKPGTVVQASILSGSNTTLAQRQDATLSELMKLYDENERYMEEAAKQKEEEQLRQQLLNVAITKRRIRTVSALKADMQERADAAGPMTTFISMKEEEVKALKKAKAEMEAATGTTAPKS
jgi:hypothetical protein